MHVEDRNVRKICVKIICLIHAENWSIQASRMVESDYAFKDTGKLAASFVKGH